MPLNTITPRNSSRTGKLFNPGQRHRANFARQATIARGEVQVSGRAQGSPPVDFNPTVYPILSQHWFGIEPPHPFDQIAGEVPSNLRRQRRSAKFR